MEDTKEIYTNGHYFGTSYEEFTLLKNTVASNTDRIEALEGQTADVSTLYHRVDILEADASTPGSVAYAVQQLEFLLLGTTDPDELDKALDTIKEIQEFLEGTAAEQFNELRNKVYNDIEPRLIDIEDIEVWDYFESDSVPVTPDTAIVDTVDAISSIDDPQSTDIVVNTQDALGYFMDPSNNSVTFQNITL